MPVPTQIQDIRVSFVDTATLGAWVTKLAADITSGKIVGFDLSTVKRDGKISGTILIPTPHDLTVTLEDPA
jgi:hypothetical protein